MFFVLVWGSEITDKSVLMKCSWEIECETPLLGDQQTSQAGHSWWAWARPIA